MDDLRYATDKPWCWACGRNERQRPHWWNGGVFCIERAHIIGGPGRKHQDSIRGCVLLCTTCHQLQHGATIRFLGEILPNLSKGNLVWLKRERDPANFDIEALNDWAIGVAPDPEPLDAWFADQYRFRHGSRGNGSAN